MCRNIQSTLTFLFLCFILSSGCAPYEEVRETIYMQNAAIKVPLLQTPVFLNTGDSTSTFEITPRIFLGNNKIFKGSAGTPTMVNGSGIFQVDTVFEGDYFYYREAPGANVYHPKKENYSITASMYNLGLDANINVTKAFSLSGGYNFSVIDKNILEGYRAGIGLRNYQSPYGIRLDGGFMWQESYYDVSNVIITSYTEWGGGSSSKVAFYRDIGVQTNSSFYLNLSITFYDRISPLGGFINIGYYKQSLLDIEPKDFDENYFNDGNPFTIGGEYSREDLRSSIETAFLNITPGLLFEFFQSARIIGGVRYVLEMGDQNVMNNILFPFVQMQFVF